MQKTEKPSTSERAAWEGQSLARERAQAQTATFLCAALVPLWALPDHLLEEPLFLQFLGLRLGSVATSVALLFAIRATSDLGRLRQLAVAALVATAAFIAPMLPQVDHYWPYLFGFSLIVWGTGAVFSIPTRHVVAICGLTLAGFGVAHAALPGPRTPAEVLGAAFYLTTAAAITVAIVGIRRRLEQKAFAATHAFEQRNRDLAEALETLRETQARLVESEKLSALGRLLTGISHELNNPVNVIQNNLAPVLGYLDDLERVLAACVEAERQLPDGGARLRELRDEIDLGFVLEDIRAALTGVGEAARRIAAMHRSLRAFTGGAALAAEVVDLNERVRSTVAGFQHSLPPGVEIVEDYAPLPPIRARLDQLDQVPLQLVQNALEAVGDRGRIVVRTETSGAGVQLSIADDGPGIAADLTPRLFEPFFTTKGVGRATGLGLSMCYEIVCAHGGRIEVDARHGPGARFVVWLPALPAAAREAPAAGSS